MEKNSKKTLMVIIAVCVILLFSPVDLITGGHIDDLVYLLTAIAGICKMVIPTGGNNDVYVDDDGYSKTE